LEVGGGAGLATIGFSFDLMLIPASSISAFSWLKESRIAIFVFLDIHVCLYLTELLIPGKSANRKNIQRLFFINLSHKHVLYRTLDEEKYSNYFIRLNV
jgi:hypothetical protein